MKNLFLLALFCPFCLPLSAQTTRYVSDVGIDREYLASYDSLMALTGEYDPESDECNVDNWIYQPGREFVFDYWYIRKGVPCKIDWHIGGTGLLDSAHLRPFTIRRVSYEIMNGNMFGMTQYRNNYYNEHGPGDYMEISGIIENARNVWLHPPRAPIFAVNELNPFPYIKAPYEVGRRWTWELEIGDQYGNGLWKRWEGNIVNRYEYAIIGVENVPTPYGPMECFVVEASAQSTLGSTHLTACFNVDYGFVRMDFTNIDGSKFLMNLVEVRQ